MRFTVNHSDTDALFLQNPVTTIKGTKGDVIMLCGTIDFKAGFLLIPYFRRVVYKGMDEITKKNEERGGQIALNTAVKVLLKQYSDRGFKAITLDKERFLDRHVFISKANIVRNHSYSQ